MDSLTRSASLAWQKSSYRFFKRTFDIAFSSMALIACLLFWPFILGIFAVSAVQCRAWPLYTQKRIGKNGKPFGCLKLRTMVKDADNVEKYLDDKQLSQWKRERKIDSDPRITSFGKIARATSIDEIPQFLNVFVGQMSIIGPRPIVEDELKNFSASERKEFLSVRPGITGWWQVFSRNKATWEDGSRKDLELFYVRNASFAMDIKVFAKTFAVIFGRTGR